MYVSHLLNRLSSTVIEGKTPLEVLFGKAAQDYSLLREFESPAYFSAKDGMVNTRAKKFVFFECQKKYERLQIVRS